MWQAYLVEMIPYAKENNYYRYVLMTVIDTFSIPIRSKTGNDTTNGFISILEGGRIPKNLQADNGNEFYNKKFQELMKHYEINHYSTYSHLKAYVVERFNRTLKSIMWK